ncbi:hypothetical protein SNEBB_003029 [Seison nebaliae]|nr:hypothetical protein SNEBB_003029 [Seison nebaliae]
MYNSNFLIFLFSIFTVLNYHTVIGQDVPDTPSEDTDYDDDGEAIDSIKSFKELRYEREDPPNVHELMKDSQLHDHKITDFVFLDIIVKKSLRDNEDLYSGKIVIGLFGDVCPLTTLNFKQLAMGSIREKSNGKKVLWYKNSEVHRIIPDFIIQMGDSVTMDGTTNESIFGKNFIDENFILSHLNVGMVSMANSGPDSNGSQFFITLAPARWLDGRHVVFGKVVKGMKVLKKLGEEKTYTIGNAPRNYIKIVNCGIYEHEPMDLTVEQCKSTSDII